MAADEKLQRIIFWSEFPDIVDWKSVEHFLNAIDLQIEVYISVSSKKEYLFLKEKILGNCEHVLAVGAWPTLEKKNGYWFSGFTSAENINWLKDFRGIPMKIDLELPLPEKEYSNFLVLKYFLNFMFKKGPNNNALADTIYDLSKDAEIIVNEFPLPAFILKRWGIFYNGKGAKKNIMAYTTIAGYMLQPLVRAYNFMFLRFFKPEMCSIGLIHHGIMKKEGYYRDVSAFEKDIKKAARLFPTIAVYSLEAALSREDPISWFAALKKHAQGQQPAQSL